MTQAVAALIVVERVRLQVAVDFFQEDVPFDNRAYDVQLALGLQFWWPRGDRQSPGDLAIGRCQIVREHPLA
jgi:hypothetical protein